MPAIIQHQLLGMKANVVSYNAIIDGVHAMGPHRLLATSGCDIGIEFLIVIVMVSFVFECCMFGASAPLSIWLLLDVCRRSLRSRSQATLKVAGDAQGRKRRSRWPHAVQSRIRKLITHKSSR